MRYASANDAHFVMNFHSQFKPNNQSCLNLIIESGGLVYNIVPLVSSGARLPVSDNIDESQTYTQPQPSYNFGNSQGLTRDLMPYDRPDKTNLFRTYAFFLQLTKNNVEELWSTVIDLVWLANSHDTKCSHYARSSRRFLGSMAYHVSCDIFQAIPLPVLNEAACHISSPSWPFPF